MGTDVCKIDCYCNSGYNNIKDKTQGGETMRSATRNEFPTTQYQYDAKTKLPELLHEVAYSIKTVHPDSTVILFGSYARGEQTAQSDLDICVLVHEITGRRENMAIDAMCAIPDGFPLPYDLVLYTFSEFEEDRKNKNLLQYRIFKDGVILSDEQRVS